MNSGQIPDVPQGPNMTVDILSIPNEKCTCGSEVWEQGMVLKKISSLISHDGKEHLGSLPVVICKKCGELYPDEVAKMIQS